MADLVAAMPHGLQYSARVCRRRSKEQCGSGLSPGLVSSLFVAGAVRERGIQAASFEHRPCSPGLPTTAVATDASKYRNNYKSAPTLSSSSTRVCCHHQPRKGGLVARPSFLSKRIPPRRRRHCFGSSQCGANVALEIRAASSPLEEMARNQALLSAAWACAAAQLLKPVSAAVLGRGFDLRLIIKSGGMPSAHSASVTALATVVGMHSGFDGPLFAVAAVGACIVMYDAQGVRRAVGKQAEVLNAVVVVVDMVTKKTPPSSAATASPHSSSRAGGNDDGTVLASPPSLVLPVPAPMVQQAEATTAAPLPGGRDTTLRDVVDQSASWLRQAAVTTAAAQEEQIKEQKSSSFSSNSNSPPPPHAAAAAADDDDDERQQQLEEQQQQGQRGSQSPEVATAAIRHVPLKESVGHTKAEVAVGALTGILVAAGVDALLATAMQQM